MTFVTIFKVLKGGILGFFEFGFGSNCSHAYIHPLGYMVVK